MAVLSKITPFLAFALPLLGRVNGGSLADIDHVVLFMQENRAFDHYFGTMAGVRGFSDPNVQVNNGTPVWSQVANETWHLNPWYLNYLGGDWLNATQCMLAGDNGWSSNHLSLNHGANDHWAVNNTPWSWGHFRRDDIPVQFALADGWTVGDMYQESVIASTNPNRVTWISGSINVPGSPQNSSEGGYPYIDNNETPGCDGDGINCYPLKWQTVAEIYQTNRISWSVFQDEDNFDDNPFAWFDQFQTSTSSSELNERGIKGQTLDDFYARAANGSLPEISYIIAPTQLSEHPPYSPRDGAWLQKQVAEAVINSPKYSKTALIVSYDETGGFGDHVVPYHSPDGTPGEWMEDPWAGEGRVYAGPGFRLPFYIISPWTRGGAVLTEPADHNSQILFIEKWQAAKGRNVTTPEMVPWRRAHMSDLTAAFDFKNPDYSLPSLPYAIPPHKNAAGEYDGSSNCEALYSVQRPTVPYSLKSDTSDDVSSLSEEGFKIVRGKLTEGRFLVFVRGSFALTNLGGGKENDLTLSSATDMHDLKSQRWVVHAVEEGGDKFLISSALDGRWITRDGSLSSSSQKAGTFKISFSPSNGYTLQSNSGKLLANGDRTDVGWSAKPSYWQAFSVTYKN